MKAKDELQRLKNANLPRLSWQDILTVKDGEMLPEEDEKALTEYFAHFVKTENGCCVCCGSKQGGDFNDALLGLLGHSEGSKFKWGLQHGEGVCSVCNWPARAYHFDVGPIKRFEAILQYHPDELQAHEPEEMT